jgi:hypothetical protein
MASISPTVTIDISRIPGKIENVYIGVDCSPEEIQIYTDLFKEFVMYSLGHMKRCQESTLVLSNMRLKPTQMLNLFDNDLELLILGRPCY